MNIINDISGGGSRCVLSSPSLVPEEQTVWEDLWK